MAGRLGGRLAARATLAVRLVRRRQVARLLLALVAVILVAGAAVALATAIRTDLLPAALTALRLRLSPAAREASSVARFEELAARHALRPGTVLVTVVTAGMRDYVLNWLYDLDRHNVTEYIVVAVDPTIYEELCSRGVPTLLFPLEWQFVDGHTVFPLPTEKHVHEFLQGAYGRVVGAKLFAIYHMVKAGYDVVFSDVDIVFPRPGFFDHLLALAESHPDAGVFVSQEPAFVCYQFKWFPEGYLPCVNTGLYMIRSRPSMVALLHEAVTATAGWTTHLANQPTFNQLLYERGMLGKVDNATGEVAWAPALVAIDNNIAMNGHHYFHGHDFPGRLPPPHEPLAVHANFLTGDSKRESLRKRGLWHDASAHFVRRNGRFAPTSCDHRTAPDGGGNACVRRCALL